MKIALLAALLLLGATTATAQAIPQPIRKQEGTSAIIKKVELPNGTKVTTTQVSKTTSTPVTAAPKPAPAAPALKAQPAPSKPEPSRPVAQRSTGRERFLVGKLDPKVMAPLVTASLKIDPAGNRPIDPAHCSPNGDGCATPNDFLAMYQKSDPDYGLAAVSQLADYMTNNLQAQAAPEGKTYWMACLVRTGNGTHKAVWNCLARKFHDGETVYVSKKTGRLVQARDCANPIGAEDVKEVKLECNEIDHWMNPGEEVHIAWLSNEPLPDDKCNALMKAGEDEWSYMLLDECPRDRCDFSAPSKALGLPVQRKPRISFKAKEAGWYKLRLTTQVGKMDGDFVFCLIWPDQYQSNGVVISKTAYGRMGQAYIIDPKNPVGRTPPPEWRGLPHDWVNSGTKVMPE